MALSRIAIYNYYSSSGEIYDYIYSYLIIFIIIKTVKLNNIIKLLPVIIYMF